MIEVSKADAESVTEALFDCPFDHYQQVQCIPFVKINDSYDATMKQVFHKQNTIRKNVECINVSNVNAFAPNVSYNNGLESICDDFIPDYYSCFIHDIDAGPSNTTNIIYNVTHET